MFGNMSGNKIKAPTASSKGCKLWGTVFNSRIWKNIISTRAIINKQTHQLVLSKMKTHFFCMEHWDDS